MHVLPAVFWNQKLQIWMQVHWLMCHVSTFMCQNAAATHVSLKMLLEVLPEKKHLDHPWEQEENVPQNLPFFQTSALG